MATKDGKKTGGRKKGQPNKNTQELMDLADKLDVNPFEILLRFAKGDFEGLNLPKYVTKPAGMGKTFEELSILPDMRLDAAYKAAQFLYPKRKAIEVEKKRSNAIKFISKDEFNKGKG